MSYSLGIETLERRAGRVAAATENQRDLARTLYAAGESAYAAGNYGTAIRYFTDAWGIIPHPAVLLTIGSTLQRLGRFQDAAYRFQRYLRENPGGSSREGAQTSLAEVQSAMEQQADERRVPPPPRPSEVSPAQVAAVTKPPEEIAQSAPRPQRDPYSGPTPVLLVGVGVGVLALAALGWWAMQGR